MFRFLFVIFLLRICELVLRGVLNLLFGDKVFVRSFFKDWGFSLVGIVVFLDGLFGVRDFVLFVVVVLVFSRVYSRYLRSIYGFVEFVIRDLVIYFFKIY